MLLHEFIATIGDDAAAVLFGVKPRTAQSWRLQDRTPRPEQAREIVERTKGRVSMAEIYASQQVA